MCRDIVQCLGAVVLGGKDAAVRADDNGAYGHLAFGGSLLRLKSAMLM